jgi:hypothetical protein
MRSLVGRAKRAGSRSLVQQLTSLTSSGDGSTLTLDFTTGVLDQRLSFSRSTNATFINSQGLVQYAEANMLVNSPMQDAANPPSGWSFFSVTGGTVSTPVAGSRTVATTAASQQPFLHQTTSGQQGLTFTLSFVVTEIVGTVSYQNICAVDGSASRQLWVNGGLISNTSTQATVGNYSLIYVAGSGNQQHRIGTGASSGSSGVCSMTFHSARLQIGSFTTATYVASSLTSAYHAPRFDHDPITRTPRGLLIEPSSINYVLYSNALYGPGWNPGGSPTIEPDLGAVAPDGVSTTTRFVFPPVAGGNPSRTYFATGYPAASYPYTVSVWMKSNTAQNYNISILGNTTTNNTVTPVWQRFHVTATAAAPLYGYVYISNESTTVSADISIWGAQLEGGTGASSYIPAVASQGNRAEDSATMAITAAELGFDLNRYTMRVRGRQNKFGLSFARSVRLHDASTEAIGMPVNNNSLFGTSRSAVNAAISEISAAATLNQDFRFAWALDADLATNTMRGSLNQSPLLSNRTAAGPTGSPTTLSFNTNALSNAYASLTIRDVKFWPRQMAASELNALTAP